VITPDAVHKAGESGGGAYTVEVPEFRADGKFLGDGDDLLFVEYLRFTFRFGGFPGYATLAERPRELAALSEGLNEFRNNRMNAIPSPGATAFSCNEPARTQCDLPKLFDPGGDPRGEHNQGSCHNQPQAR